MMITRRKLVGSLGVGAGGLLLSGCDRVAGTPAFRSFVEGADGLTIDFTRLVSKRDALAREYTLADLSPVFRANGTRVPAASEYQTLMANNFADYRLRIDGLVRQPLSLSLAQLRSLPVRTQITRHDCVEGWSAIGEWQGPQLAALLDAAKVREGANFIVFHCADVLYNRPYYESIDMVDAYHPQTIIAHSLNGEPLPEKNGAPLRMRIERQLGYKQAKYLRAIEAVASFDAIGQGNGGFWEDVAGYQWYAGI